MQHDALLFLALMAQLYGPLCLQTQTVKTSLCILTVNFNVQGSMTVGDTVLFLTLMAQLYGPLNFFGTYYRVIQQYMIDMENLLQLLDTPGATRFHSLQACSAVAHNIAG
jgi:ATP-binding cassette subfamily B (MDR/TAP) protein 6